MVLVVVVSHDLVAKQEQGGEFAGCPKSAARCHFLLLTPDSFIQFASSPKFVINIYMK